MHQAPDVDMANTFSNENSWIVQCLSLATIGVLAYFHIAPVILG